MLPLPQSLKFPPLFRCPVRNFNLLVPYLDKIPPGSFIKKYLTIYDCLAHVALILSRPLLLPVRFQEKHLEFQNSWERKHCIANLDLVSLIEINLKFEASYVFK